jgi:hypothetical protein
MHYRRSSTVTWELVDERAVILDAEGSTLTTLNPIGTLIWRQLDEPRDPAELSARLASRFPSVDRSELESDARHFLDCLARDGLVVLRAA